MATCTSSAQDFVEEPSKVPNGRNCDAARDAPFRLFDLPQELQDEIFALACPRKDNLRNVLRDEWKAKQEHIRKTGGHNSSSLPFPTKVSEWLVSKRYFRMAAGAWMGSQSFSEPTDTSHLAFEVLLDGGCGLRMECATEASVRIHYSYRKMRFKTVAKCRKLRVLAVYVSDDIFDLIQEKLA